MSGWHDFYVLAGTASATLVGLMSLMQRVRVMLRFGVSGVSYLAIIAAGILLLSSRNSALIWLLIATVVLLVVSLRNTGDLLVTVADGTRST